MVICSPPNRPLPVTKLFNLKPKIYLIQFEYRLFTFTIVCYRNEMTDDEYNESKEDTVEQLKEFNDRLNKITAGHMTIHDELTIIHLVSNKFI